MCSLHADGETHRVKYSLFIVFLEIFTPTRKTPFHLLAKVAWRKKRILEHNLGYIYDTGVEFSKIDAEGEFQDLLEQLVKAKLEKVLS